ncbi:GNAT family N-acetyltransferase [Ursidibacter sp. B-7004-1]
MMYKLPQQIVINNEILLEKINDGHSEAIFTQIDRHRNYLSQFVHWTRFTHKLEDSQNFVKLCKKEAESGESFVWAICWQGKAVGTISFNKPIDWQTRTVHIGYWLSPEVQGKGIVTQAVNAIINATQGKFDHYILRCAIHNSRSNAVAQRCGFAFVEVQENAEKIGDNLYSLNVYRRSSLI